MAEKVRARVRKRTVWARVTVRARKLGGEMGLRKRARATVRTRWRVRVTVRARKLGGEMGLRKSKKSVCARERAR